ncbi:MAG: hypothetical protein AVDCRST_MAG47-1789, partial [uncultured Nocardioidaceae bacterium]
GSEASGSPAARAARRGCFGGARRGRARPRIGGDPAPWSVLQDRVLRLADPGSALVAVPAARARGRLVVARGIARRTRPRPAPLGRDERGHGPLRRERLGRRAGGPRLSVPDPGRGHRSVLGAARQSGRPRRTPASRPAYAGNV